LGGISLGFALGRLVLCVFLAGSVGLSWNCPTDVAHRSWNVTSFVPAGLCRGDVAVRAATRRLSQRSTTPPLPVVKGLLHARGKLRLERAESSVDVSAEVGTAEGEGPLPPESPTEQLPCTRAIAVMGLPAAFRSRTVKGAGCRRVLSRRLLYIPGCAWLPLRITRLRLAASLQWPPLARR